MIVGLFGDVGSGKTISAVRFIKEFSDKGFNIFSNISLDKIDFTPLSLDDLLDIIEFGKTIPDRSVYFVDEITLYMDSRTSGTKIQRLLSYMLLQNRKHDNFYFIYTTQYPDLIDRRLWITTPIKISCSSIKHKNLTVVYRNWYIKHLLKVNTKSDFFIADPYFQYYNTKEIVRIPKTARFNKQPIRKDSDLTKFGGNNET